MRAISTWGDINLIKCCLLLGKWDAFNLVGCMDRIRPILRQNMQIKRNEALSQTAYDLSQLHIYIAWNGVPHINKQTKQINFSISCNLFKT